MKRVAVTIVIAAIALTAGTAYALDRFYKGDVDGGGIVEFRAEIHGDNPQRVYRFKWANVPIHNCTGGGSGATNYTKSGFAMKVNNHREFHGTHDVYGNATATVTGKFSRNHRRVSGTFRVEGSVTSCSNGDTGVLDWAHTPGS
jgi:hypothetical protein